METKTAIVMIYECLKTIQENSSKFPDQIINLQKAIQDVEHKIELTNFNASEGYRYAKQIKDFRTKRREYKDAMIYIEDFSKILEMDKVIPQLEQLIETTDRRLSERVYQLRTEEDESGDIKKGDKKIVITSEGKIENQGKTALALNKKELEENHNGYYIKGKDIISRRVYIKEYVRQGLVRCLIEESDDDIHLAEVKVSKLVNLDGTPFVVTKRFMKFGK